MAPDGQIDKLIATIAGFDRRRCMDELRRIRRPRLDFTDDFLRKLDLDHLRHVLLAASLQSRKTSGG